MKRWGLLSVVLGLLAAPGVARAVDVTSAGDTLPGDLVVRAACVNPALGLCTLRGATEIGAAVITFPAGLGAITLANGPVSVGTGTTIDGGSPRQAIIGPAGALLVAGASATVKNLDISGSAAAAVTVTGTGATLSRNVIRSNGTGVVVDTGGTATITSNNVIDNSSDGIRVTGGAATIGAFRVIPGPAAAENFINGNAGDGIESLPPGTTRLLRNRGTNGAGSLFFDVGRDGLRGGPPRPTIAGAGITMASGTAAPRSIVRLYRATGDARGLAAFLGQTRTAATGRWSVTYGALPPNTWVAANRGASNGANPSEFSFALLDVTPPDTQMNSGPPGLTNDATPSFKFGSADPAATFQCKFDAGAYVACTSPLTLPALPDGKHRLSVRATDPAGNVDRTPARRSFTLDTDMPIVSLSRTARLAKRRMKVTVTCTNRRESCHGKLLLRRGRTRLKSVPFALNPRRSRTVTFRLSSKTVGTVMRARRPSLTVVATTRDGAGNGATLTRRLRLR